MSSEIVTRKRAAANKNKSTKEITGSISSPARVPAREVAAPGRPARPVEEVIHVQKDAQLQRGDYCKLAAFLIVSTIVFFSITTIVFIANEKNSSSSTQSNLQTSDWLTRLKNFVYFFSPDPNTDDEPTYNLYEKPIDEDPSSVDVQLEPRYLDILWSYYPFGDPSDEQPSPEPAETDQGEGTNTSLESETDKDSRGDNSDESLNDDELENDKDDSENDRESEENLADDEKKSEDDDSDEKDDPNDQDDEKKSDDDDSDEKDDPNDQDDDENDVSKPTDDSENTHKPYRSHGFYSYKKHETEDEEDDRTDTEDNDHTSDESKEQVDRRDQRFNYYHNRESEEERNKYEYIKGEDDINDSSEQGAREKFDSGEDTKDEDEQDVKNDENEQDVKNDENEQDVKNDENESDSSEEVEQKIGVIQEEESGNVANDVNLEEAEGIRVMAEGRRKAEEYFARKEAEKAKNKTLEKYLETPSNSSGEQSENDSGDEQTAESNIPVDSEKSQTPSETGSELEDDDVDYAPYGTTNYKRMNITNREDWPHRHLLDEADDDWNRNENFINASRKYVAVLRESPRSVRARFGMAIIKDRFTDNARSNSMLNGLIRDYKEILNTPNVPEAIEKIVVAKVIPRMRFSGDYKDCVPILRKVVEKYPKEIPYQIDLAVSYLILNKLPEAESVLERVLEIEPDNGLALVNYGFVMKMKGNLEKAVETLSRGINSGVKGTEDSKFYYHLGEAMQRLGYSKQALELYQKAADKRIFRSKYQRSLYNVKGLTAKPWWTLNETKYESFFQSLESNWEKIRDEVLSVIEAEKYDTFRDEAEQLRETGEWKQLEIFSRGVEKPECEKFPITCDLIRGFAPAAKCKRGQIKFSIMQPGTHVWPHCGPTNCRLRAHLGLIVPENVTIRVADETRRWQEGKVLVFDDSFEHEVWHKGKSSRLVLIVDVWHPSLSDYLRKHLPPI